MNFLGFIWYTLVGVLPHRQEFVLKNQVKINRKILTHVHSVTQSVTAK